ncbi:MAG: Bro-N domain-containing protein [Nanoarchaeota archaeon]|nr:Bro-N domain-containing protein [Nanoarchaeota archaeon]MBU4351805.1 Bro-N domain-containing protein [Nanoarchaeota archaeon]
MVEKNKIVVFQDRKIRRIWYKEEWYFSVVDIVQVLTESPTPRQYWGKIKDREFLQLELSPIWVQLKLEAPDSKLRLTDCANTKNMFRIIQSIPSKKAEPFKLWLAQVGYERIEEIENPELGQNRIKEYYELKGYPKEWIDKRLRGIAIRQELTDEWKNRDVKTEKEFAILTNEISKATFGKTVGEYKEFKQLQIKNQNLRDHMTDWELILTMFGEKATTDITKETNSQGFEKCKDSAKEGGQAANEARKSIEKRLGKSIISKENFLPKQKEKKKLRP